MAAKRIPSTSSLSQRQIAIYIYIYVCTWIYIYIYTHIFMSTNIFVDNGLSGASTGPTRARLGRWPTWGRWDSDLV